MRFILGTAAVAAILAAASPAAAAGVTSTANAKARGLVLTSKSLAKDRDLDFGAVTVDSSIGGGTITIAAQESLSKTPTGGVLPLAGAASSAKFIGYGAPGQTVQLNLTQPAGGKLQGPGVNQIDVLLFQDAPTKVVGTNSTTFEAFVGGTFTLAADQAAGLYSGDFTLVAEYP